jgi:hypothetical protein
MTENLIASLSHVLFPLCILNTLIKVTTRRRIMLLTISSRISLTIISILNRLSHYRGLSIHWRQSSTRWLLLHLHFHFILRSLITLHCTALRTLPNPHLLLESQLRRSFNFYSYTIRATILTSGLNSCFVSNVSYGYPLLGVGDYVY